MGWAAHSTVHITNDARSQRREWLENVWLVPLMSCPLVRPHRSGGDWRWHDKEGGERWIELISSHYWGIKEDKCLSCKHNAEQLRSSKVENPSLWIGTLPHQGEANEFSFIWWRKQDITLSKTRGLFSCWRTEWNEHLHVKSPKP